VKSTKAMRDRVRELSKPEQDDYDRAVVCILDDLETLRAATIEECIERCSRAVTARLFCRDPIMCPYPHCGCSLDPGTTEDMLDELVSQVRAKTIEECAKVVEKYPGSDGAPVLWRVAAALRALAKEGDEQRLDPLRNNPIVGFMSEKQANDIIADMQESGEMLRERPPTK